MTSPTLKKFCVVLNLRETRYAYFTAKDAVTAVSMAEGLYDASGADGFTIDEQWYGPFVAEEEVP